MRYSIEVLDTIKKVHLALIRKEKREHFSVLTAVAKAVREPLLLPYSGTLSH